MNGQLTPAFILHQRPYQESSLLLDIFSEGYGKVSLIAKGVRQKKRSQLGILQLYQPVLLSWVGRGELYTLTNVEADGPRYNLQGEASLCGFYINELLAKLLIAQEAETEIFKAYQRVLYGLQQGRQIQIELRLFEKRLLMHLGYGLVLDRETDNGDKIEDEINYYYQPDSGLHQWQPGQTGSTISGRSLHHLIEESGFDEMSLQEIKQLMRTVIHFYLAGKPLKSRQLFAKNYKKT